MKKLSRQQWLFVAIALIGFALLKAGLIYWYLQQKAQPQQQTVQCQALQQGCTLPDGSVLRFDRPPRHSEPFVVTLQGGGEETPSAEFSMENMDMGFNRYRFVGTAQQWQAKVTLPVCISGSGDWLLDLHRGTHTYRVRFHSS